MTPIGTGVTATELGGLAWRKSTRSTPEGNCVELAALDGGAVAVRDSRDPGGPVLVFSPAELRRLR